MRASEGTRDTLIGIGRAIGSGIEGLGSRLERRRQESAAARERESVREDRESEREWQHAEDRARLTGEWREPGTEGPGVQTLEARRMDPAVTAKTKRDAEDARHVLTDVRRHMENARSRMRDLEEMAVLSGEVMQNQTWQDEYITNRDTLAGLEKVEREMAKRAQLGDGLPDVAIEVNGHPIDVNDPTLRAKSAEEKLERAKSLAERARKTGSRFTEVQAARMASEAQGEIARAKRSEQGRKDEADAAQAQANGEGLFSWAMQNEALAGVPKAIKSQVAASVMAKRMTYAQGRQALESYGRGTPEYGARQGEVENARRGAQGLPTAGEAREQDAAARKDRFDFGQRRAADAGEKSMRREQEEQSGRIVRDIESDLTKTVEERSLTGKVTLKPVPMNWGKYSEAELRTALGDATLGPEAKTAVEAELGRRGQLGSASERTGYGNDLPDTPEGRARRNWIRWMKANPNVDAAERKAAAARFQAEEGL